MTRRINILFFLSMILSPLALRSQDYNSEADGLYGYTSLNFDPSSNIVTAYSETDADPTVSSYYQVNVSLSLQDQNHNTLADPSASSSGNYVSVTATAQGSPSTTYEAIGLHYVTETQSQYECLYNGSGYQQCNYYFVDYYEEQIFQSADVNQPGLFDFTSDGPDTPDSTNEIVLGQTYDNVSLTTPAACGDVRDQIIGEYRTNQTPFLPVCNDFTQSSPDSNWGFSQLNSGNYSWAIIGTYFTAGLDAVNSDVGGITINSAYRNPAAEKTAATSAGTHYPPGSRHQYGDAVDVATGSNQGTFNAIRSAGINHAACAEPQQNSGVGHVHLDWRQQAPLRWKTQCTSTWLQ